jgi:hypothetical protein
LAILIPRLIELCDRLPERLSVTARIMIIDNDPAMSARAIVDQFYDQRVSFLAESRPGVVAVRNRALAQARSDDALIFIDDDELPTDSWLEALLDTWLGTSADAVAGPVRAQLPDSTDDWIRAGGFFDRSFRWGLVTGDQIVEVGAGNLLLDMATVRAMELTFDEGFGLSGGEDSLLTRTLTRAGASIVWSADAAVDDPVPVERVTRSWVCRRAVSSGNTGSRVQLALEPTAVRRAALRLRLFAGGSVRFAGGGLGLLVGLARRSQRRQARSARTLFRGAGMALGAVGLTYLPYARTGSRWQWTPQLSR